MRIIGGKDFYDGVMAYGQDDTVFVRKRYSEVEGIPATEVPLRHPKEAQRVSDQLERWADYLLEATPVMVWFAGKRFGGVCLRDKLTGVDRGAAWDERSYREALERRVRWADGLRDIMKSHRYRQAIHDLFNAEGTEQERNWLIENGVSIAICKRERWDKGLSWKFDTDGLKALGFAKALDPYTAYQELSMWVGGVLANPERPTAELSDEDKIAKRGFDEWSFRKMPSP